jgi:hypothetical protein
MRKNKKILLITLFIGLVVVLDSCLTFRQSDKSAIKEFKKIGIDLRLNTLVINQRNLHYATVGLNCWFVIISSLPFDYTP